MKFHKEFKPQGDGGSLSIAYEGLRAAIRSGRLPAGARLREIELATTLGVSRTPVREAIRRLEAEGLVDHAPRKGAVVRALDRSEVLEIYEMRALLEGAAARMAAERASPAQLEEMRELNDLMAGADDEGAQAAAANRRFHAALFDAAQNSYLVRAIEAVSTTLILLGPTTLADPGRAARAHAEHLVVLAAIKEKDADAAEAAARAHIVSAQRARLKDWRMQAIQAEAAQESAFEQGEENG